MRIETSYLVKVEVTLEHGFSPFVFEPVFDLWNDFIDFFGDCLVFFLFGISYLGSYID